MGPGRTSILAALYILCRVLQGVFTVPLISHKPESWNRLIPYSIRKCLRRRVAKLYHPPSVESDGYIWQPFMDLEWMAGRNLMHPVLVHVVHMFNCLTTRHEEENMVRLRMKWIGRLILFIGLPGLFFFGCSNSSSNSSSNGNPSFSEYFKLRVAKYPFTVAGSQFPVFFSELI